MKSIAEKIAELSEELEMLQDEEQEYMDNMPENLQGSERYEVADQAIDTMEVAIDRLNDVCTELEEIYEN
jgi:flagellar biosynthesis chaperone FliJ